MFHLFSARRSSCPFDDRLDPNGAKAPVTFTTDSHEAYRAERRAELWLTEALL